MALVPGNCVSSSMEQCLLLVCKRGDETVVLKIKNGADYDDLVRMLCTNFKDLFAGDFSLSYSIPGHPVCLLRDKSELKNMIELVRALDLKFVDVTVSIGSSSVCRSQFDGVAVSGRDVTVCNVRDCDEALAASLSSSNGDRVLLLNSWSGAVNHVGQRFCGGAVEFRNALCKYSVERGFGFDYVKNTKEKVVAVCSKRCEEGCQWAVTGSLCKVNGFFYIKKLVNQHSCSLVLQSSTSKRMGSKLISQLVVDLVKRSPSLTASEVVDHFQNNYGLSIPYGKAWRALEKNKGNCIW